MLEPADTLEGDMVSMGMPRRSFAAPKQGTRLVKIACNKCGYTARTTKRWIEGGFFDGGKGYEHHKGGLPTCHCGGKFKVAGGDEKKHTPDVPGQSKMFGVEED